MVTEEAFNEEHVSKISPETVSVFKLEVFYGTNRKVIFLPNNIHVSQIILN